MPSLASIGLVRVPLARRISPFSPLSTDDMTPERNEPAAADRYAAPVPAEPPAEDVAAFRRTLLEKLTYMVGRDRVHAQDRDWLVATALAARDRVVDSWVDATRRTYRDGRKRVYYF